MLFAKPKRTLIRLLIVEDEPLVAFDNEHFLRAEGFEIVATVDGVADATAHLAENGDVQLVLVDVSLSDGSGLDVARAAAERGVPVLFVTGGLPDGAAEVAHGCLDKPYSQRSLLRAIECVDQLVQGSSPKKLPSGLRLFRQAESSAG